MAGKSPTNWTVLEIFMLCWVSSGVFLGLRDDSGSTTRALLPNMARVVEQEVQEEDDVPETEPRGFGLIGSSESVNTGAIGVVG